MNAKRIISFFMALSVLTAVTSCGSFGKEGGFGEGKNIFAEAEEDFEESLDDESSEILDDLYEYYYDDSQDAVETDPDDFEREAENAEPPEEPKASSAVTEARMPETEPAHEAGEDAEVIYQADPDQNSAAEQQTQPPAEAPKPTSPPAAYPPKFSTFSSSSNLADQTTSAGSYSYKPDYAFDGNLSSCWCEGASGSGEGEYLLASANGLQRVSQLEIYNGLCESEDIFNKNNRIKECVLEFSNGTSYNVTLSGDYAAQPCVIAIPEAVDTEYIKLTILSVYEGSKYDDTCISEINIK